MPTYTFVNRNTKEEKTEVMTIANMQQYIKDNPDWFVSIQPTIGRDNFVASRRTNIHVDGELASLYKAIQKENPGNTIDF